MSEANSSSTIDEEEEASSERCDYGSVEIMASVRADMKAGELKKEQHSEPKMPEAVERKVGDADFSRDAQDDGGETAVTKHWPPTKMTSDDDDKEDDRDFSDDDPEKLYVREVELLDKLTKAGGSPKACQSRLKRMEQLLLERLARAHKLTKAGGWQKAGQSRINRMKQLLLERLARAASTHWKVKLQRDMKDAFEKVIQNMEKDIKDMKLF
jgi:hypothetical protein